MKQLKMRAIPAVMLVLTLIALAVLVPAAASTHANAEDRSGTATVLYTPESWPFNISVSGLGQLELVEVKMGPPSSNENARAAESVYPGVVVRDGTLELDVGQAQTLMFKLTPDDGASITSIHLGDTDITDTLDADNILAVPTDTAEGDLVVAFSTTTSGGVTPPAPSDNTGTTDNTGDTGAQKLVQTGDIPWYAALAALAALVALVATRLSRRRAHAASSVPQHAATSVALHAVNHPTRFASFGAAGMLYEDDGR